MHTLYVLFDYAEQADHDNMVAAERFLFALSAATFEWPGLVGFKPVRWSVDLRCVVVRLVTEQPLSDADAEDAVQRYLYAMGELPGEFTYLAPD